MLSRASTVVAAMVVLVIDMASIGTAVSYGTVIVAFGDSTTAIRPTVPKVYAQILQDKLPGRLGQSVTVHNAGVGGNQTHDALARLDTDVRTRNPNIVIIQFGINDSYMYGGVTYSAVPIDANTQVNHAHASYGNFTANLTSIVTTLKGDVARVILMTPNQLRTTGAGIVESALQNDTLATYAQVVRNVAAAEHVELLDVWQLYADYAAVPGHSIDDLLVDSQHPGQLGHQMVADRLIAMIVRNPAPAGVSDSGVSGKRYLTIDARHRQSRLRRARGR